MEKFLEKLNKKLHQKRLTKSFYDFKSRTFKRLSLRKRYNFRSVIK